MTRITITMQAMAMGGKSLTNRSRSLAGRGWWRRRNRGCVAVLTLAGALLICMDAVAQEPLDRLRTKDLTVIAAQVRAAVPYIRRGLDLLATSQDAEGLRASFENAQAAYRHLRRAQGNTEVVIATSRSPDPVLVFQKDRMWEIRRHLLRCSSSVAHGQPRAVSHCAENLAEALRKLRALVATLP